MGDDTKTKAEKFREAADRVKEMTHTPSPPPPPKLDTSSDDIFRQLGEQER